MPKQSDVAYLLWWYGQQGITSGFNPTPTSALAKRPAEKTRDLADQLRLLEEEMNAFPDCSLSQTAQNTVFSDGNPLGDIMVIGEAPGAEEDRLGKPFVGLSGRLLDQIFKTMGWTRDHFLYITNVVPWRPPLNRQPSSQEISLCFPFLERHIALIQPKLLILVGAVACRTVLKTDQPIGVLQKKITSYDHPDLPQPIPTVALYHPAYLLRSPGQKRVVWERLCHLKEFLKQDPSLSHLVVDPYLSSNPSSL